MSKLMFFSTSRIIAILALIFGVLMLAISQHLPILAGVFLIIVAIILFLKPK